MSAADERAKHRTGLARGRLPRKERAGYAVDERSEALKAATAVFDKALQFSRKEPDAWHRCLYLAAMARIAPDGLVAPIAAEALVAAMHCGDEYRRVIAGAWPLRALAERRKSADVQQMLARLLDVADHIEHPVCKAGALPSLWTAVSPLTAKRKQPVLDSLLAACQAADSWKAGVIMQYVALVVANEDKPQAQRIIDSMRESVYKRRAQKRLDVGQLETSGLWDWTSRTQELRSVHQMVENWHGTL